MRDTSEGHKVAFVVPFIACCKQTGLLVVTACYFAMAEARSAVVEPRVVDAEEEVRDTWTDFILAWRRQLVKGFFKTR